MKRAGLANRLIIVPQGIKKPTSFPEFSLTAGKKLRVGAHSSQKRVLFQLLNKLVGNPGRELAPERRKTSRSSAPGAFSRESITPYASILMQRWRRRRFTRAPGAMPRHLPRGTMAMPPRSRHRGSAGEPV